MSVWVFEFIPGFMEKGHIIGAVPVTETNTIFFAFLDQYIEQIEQTGDDEWRYDPGFQLSKSLELIELPIEVMYRKGRPERIQVSLIKLFSPL